MLLRNKMERRCIVCRERIYECMGFVIARDHLDFLDGKRKTIREIRGKDMLKLTLTYNVSEGVLVERSQEEIRKDLERYLAPSP